MCGLVTKLYLNQLFVTPWTVARQAPLFMGFPRQEYWSGLPFPSPGALPDPGIEPVSLIVQVDSLPLSHLGSHKELKCTFKVFKYSSSQHNEYTAYRN